MELKFVLFFVIVLACTSRIYTKDYDDDEAESDDNLLSKINCKVGDKYEYMMATQSSLLDEYDANLLVKTKIELKCQEKKMWLNQTSGELKNGQLFEARITSFTPVHLNESKAETVTIKSGLQMAALFASLEKLPDSPRPNITNKRQPNLKVGAVNDFFANFAKSFGELIKQLFQSLVNWFEGLVKKRRNGGAQSVLRTSGISWKCKENKRQKRQSFKTLNFEQFTRETNDLFQHPFSFLQLEDGSVQNVHLAPQESNPSVMHFKRFLAQSFSTQLDGRKKTLREQSTLGDHLSHYQMEYDEPDRSKVTPEEYLNTAVHHRAKRAEAGHSHLVSVVRSIRRPDMISHMPGSERNQYRHKKLDLADIEFDAQQVQLVEDNMLVASGGYFHSILPLQHKENSKQRRTRSVDNTTTTPDAADDFDRVLQKYLTLNLEYSMVRITKNRWRRSTDSQSEQHVSSRAISTYMSKMKNMAETGSDFLVNTAANLFRKKRQAEEDTDIDKNVVCKEVPHKQGLNGQIEREDSNVVKDDSGVSQFKECFEYKEFGSGWLKAFFNRSLLTSSKRGKPLETFETKYKLGAQMWGENMFMGEIDILKDNDVSKLRINLFGSEYIDLNLCDIRDKVFSQANQIPLFSENIWFMTNVGINIKYDLQFQVQVPSVVCDTDSIKAVANNSVILSRMIADQFNLHQNSKIELGGAFDASFLIFNGAMRLNGNFDMDSNIDFGNSCLSARSLVKPMNVSLDFNYKFFHPLCGEWMEDSWIPKQLSWKLHKAYRNSWFDNVCV